MMRFGLHATFILNFAEKGDLLSLHFILSEIVGHYYLNFHFFVTLS